MQLEPLEDRLTPSALDFVPIANVVFHDLAVTKIPLPPGVQIDFDPLLIGSATSGAGGGKITEQIHIGGVLQKQITIPSALAGTPGQTWTLDAFYDLTGNETETIIPPTFESGSISAAYNLAATLTEVLLPPDPTTQPTWTSTGTITEQGTLNAVISPPDPVTGISQLSMMFAQTGIARNPWIETRVGGGFQNLILVWNVQADIQSTGMTQEVLYPGGPAATMPASQTASFWQQDQVTECLMPVIPFHPPQPCITINEMFSAWGSVTETMLFPQTAFTPEVDTGTTQYQAQLSETIMMPDGATQTLTQNSMDMGTFFEIKDWS